MDNDLGQFNMMRETQEISAGSNIFVDMYQLKENIRGLSGTGISISKLTPLSNDLSGLLSSDYFTISRPHAVESVKTGQKATEYNVRYKVLKDRILKDFVEKNHDGRSTNAMTGKWIFGTMNQSRIRANTEKIAGYSKIKAFNINDSFPSFDEVTFKNNYSAITLGFFRNRILPIIDRLSSVYYNVKDSRFTYPSRKGDIETILKKGSGLVPPVKIYSATWKNIGDGKDRMIIGQGSCEANNFMRYGQCEAGAMDEYTKHSAGYTDGEERVLIETKHYPQHKHKIECSTVSFRTAFHLRGTVAALCCTGVTNNYQTSGGQQHQATTGTITPFRMTGSVTFSTAAEYGSSIRIHDQIYTTSGNRIVTSKASSHNNIPPVIMVKMVERV